MRALACVIALLVLGCDKKGDKEDKDGATAKSEAAKTEDNKPTAEQCKAAYAHVAELRAKKEGSTAAKVLEMQEVFIEHCPQMKTKAALDCMSAMTEWTVEKENECGRK